MAVTFSVRSFQATSVPEPATLTLTTIGAFGLLFYRWRRPRGPSRPTSHESLEPVRIRSEEPNYDYRR